MGELTLEGLKDDLRNWESLGVLSHARTNNWCKYIDAAIREHDALRAEVERLRASQQWQPIETAPRDGKAFFWIVPKTAEETFQDTSGNLILSKAPPHWELCYFRGWNSLSKATHWMPLPEPPAKDNDNA